MVFRSAKTPRLLALILGIILIVGLTGCSSKGYRKHFWELWKPKKPSTAMIEDDLIPPPPPPEVAGEPVGSSRVGEDGLPLPSPIRGEAKGLISAIQTVYFGFDSSELSGEAVSTLEANAAWIIENASSGIQIQVEGHCDEQGTVEYNYNLAQRRADAVREYLVGLGVDGSILHPISYGEDRPEVMGSGEDAYTKNRRVQFLVY